MTHAGDGQTLLGGGGGQKCPGAAEQDPAQLTGVQLVQQITAEGHGAAAAAGATGVDILCGVVEHQCAAIRQLSAKAQSLPSGQLQQRLLAQLSQVACDDEVKVLGGPVQVFQMGPNGGKGGRG